MTVKTVPDYLYQTAARVPDKVAFVDDRRSETFAEVLTEAEKVASSLLASSLTHRPVAVYMGKQVECVNSFLGIALSGCYYTMLDADMPVARIDKILSTLQPAAIITDRAHEEACRGFAGNAAVLVYEELMQQTADPAGIAAARQATLETDVLFVLFTSGSTGMPKGVIITHRNLITYLESCATAFGLDETIVFGNQVPFYFVMSVMDIYQTLRNGGTMYIIPKMAFLFPGMLMQYLIDNKVNTLYWVPSILCMVANLGALPDFHMDELKLVMFGGESMPIKQLNMWRHEYPEAAFFNSYGPTEMTDILTYYRIDRDLPEDGGMPIGIPLEHMQCLVLDENNQPVKPGEMGELCGRGPSLALGYYNDPVKTAGVFVQNPLVTAYADRIYRTGDLVQVNEQGELIFVGRKDFQIKHMGNRIELGEIEAAVSAMDGIQRVCCLYDTGRSRIVAFYTGPVEVSALKARLKQTLPDYMVPGKVVKLDQMPLNLNGKVDRSLLKQQL